MDCKKVKKIFRVVGIKGGGAFANFGTEVPKLAQQFLTRLDEVGNHSGTEIALFEPKRDANHLDGNYYVGLIVNDTLKEVPVGMDYIETAQAYVTTRGKIINIDYLHNQLLKWADNQGYKRDLESHIVETYHPMENGEEEVEIYLPIHI
ncbi:GyrI-like domain-containing protein [Lederbergia citrea]|uniref:AraC family transcriptional regulator n=1 Tax=Lederbergia citrea TaxID=2833581 RepID=A0A942UNN9_9BACI|nr:AraC family transcriptional regulator [Lederbergia citrea]MBS4179194.1 AraC family transcriptional regulator [Lederbergia citrea]MBS4205857.1 AraC family transcriptional regulator [Lederbergia citrea]MBS4224695.1 AraC family transcriptional regulator [Lederbergia citrea]